MVWTRRPKLQPIVNPHPSLADPSLELHYFMDAAGAWHEVVGRERAAALVASCAATGQVDAPLRWEDGRALEHELDVLRGWSLAGGDGGERGAAAVVVA